MTDKPKTLYVHEPHIGYRPATAGEIGEVARQFEEVLRSLLSEGCIPIPVTVTWAGQRRYRTELHARNNCEHVWERGEPRVHADTTEPIYVFGTGEIERGELRDQEERY